MTPARVLKLPSQVEFPGGKLVYVIAFMPSPENGLPMAICTDCEGKPLETYNSDGYINYTPALGDMVSGAEAAEILNRSSSFVRKRCEDRTFGTAIKQRNKWLIKRKEITEYKNRCLRKI